MKIPGGRGCWTQLWMIGTHNEGNDATDRSAPAEWGGEMDFLETYAGWTAVGGSCDASRNDSPQYGRVARHGERRLPAVLVGDDPQDTTDTVGPQPRGPGNSICDRWFKLGVLWPHDGTDLIWYFADSPDNTPSGATTATLHRDWALHAVGVDRPGDAADLGSVEFEERR